MWHAIGYDTIEYDVPLKERDASHGDTSVCNEARNDSACLFLSTVRIIVQK